MSDRKRDRDEDTTQYNDEDGRRHGHPSQRSSSSDGNHSTFRYGDADPTNPSSSASGFWFLSQEQDPRDDPDNPSDSELQEIQEAERLFGDVSMLSNHDSSNPFSIPIRGDRGSLPAPAPTLEWLCIAQVARNIIQSSESTEQDSDEAYIKEKTTKSITEALPRLYKEDLCTPAVIRWCLWDGLEELDLSIPGLSFPDSALADAYLRLACELHKQPQLTHLRMANNPYATDEFMILLFLGDRSCSEEARTGAASNETPAKKWLSIDLTGCIEVTQKTWQHAGVMLDELLELKLGGTGLQSLEGLENARQLQTLSLAYCDQLNPSEDAWFSIALKNMTELHTLDLEGLTLTIQILEILIRERGHTLQVLSLKQTRGYFAELRNHAAIPFTPMIPTNGSNGSLHHEGGSARIQFHALHTLDICYIANDNLLAVVQQLAPRLRNIDLAHSADLSGDAVQRYFNTDARNDPDKRHNAALEPESDHDPESGLGFHRINMSQCSRIGEQTLIDLRWSVDLRHVYLPPGCTDEGLSRILRSCPQLSFLHGSACARLTDAGWKRGLPNGSCLETIRVCYCQELTDTFLRCLRRRCRDLCALDVSGLSRISYAAVASLLRACKSLQILTIEGCNRITQAHALSLRSRFPTCTINWE